MYKTVHGGGIYSLAEIGMGIAMNSTLKKEQETVAIEIKINYLKPVQATKLICDSKIIQLGKNIAVLESEIKDESLLVAKAMGTFSIFKSKENSWLSGKNQLEKIISLHNISYQT